MKHWIVIGLLVVVGWSATPGLLHAGTLAELETAVQTHYTAGAIYDSDLKATLDDVVNQAKLAVDARAETAYRNSFIDLLNAYVGVGITAAAATSLSSVAQP